MILTVKVIPNSRKNELEGFLEGILKVRIKAPPDKGKANEQLIEFLAETLQMPKYQIRIVSGHSSRLKKIEITGKAVWPLHLQNEGKR